MSKSENIGPPATEETAIMTVRAHIWNAAQIVESVSKGRPISVNAAHEVYVDPLVTANLEGAAKLIMAGQIERADELVDTLSLALLALMFRQGNTTTRYADGSAGRLM